MEKPLRSSGRIKGRGEAAATCASDYAHTVPYAVTLRLDPTSAVRVERIWRAIADLVGEDHALQLGYGPHLTLTVLPDSAPAKVVEAAVFQAARTWNTLPLVLVGLGVFPGPHPVLWAVPVVTDALLAQHEALHAALGPLPVYPHYRPGAWVPHVTLTAEGRSPAAQILDAALSVWDGPIEGQFDRVELVRFRPVAVLRSKILPTTLARG